MDIRKFAEVVRAQLLWELNDLEEIRIEKVLKNNSVERIGLLFVQKNSNVSPTIYLESFYESYQCGRSMENILEAIVDAYRDDSLQKSIDVSFMRDWNKAKTMVAFKLINTEQNRELLQQVPHKEVLDLSMVFYILVRRYGGTIQIYNSHCKMWGIDEEELVKAAEENSPEICPVRLENLCDMAAGMFGKEEEEFLH